MHYVWDEVRAWIDWHEKWQEFRRKANQLAKVYERGLAEWGLDNTASWRY